MQRYQDKQYNLEFATFYPVFESQTVVIRGDRISMHDRQVISKAEVNEIRRVIQNVTIPYKEEVVKKQERRVKVQSLFDKIRGRLPARLFGGTLTTKDH